MQCSPSWPRFSNRSPMSAYAPTYTNSRTNRCLAGSSRDGRSTRPPRDMKIDVPEEFIRALAEELAAKLDMRGAVGAVPTPWYSTPEAIAYTRLPEGTFRQHAAKGIFPSEGGRSKVFHRDDLDRGIRLLRERSRLAERLRVTG